MSSEDEEGTDRKLEPKKRLAPSLRYSAKVSEDDDDSDGRNSWNGEKPKLHRYKGPMKVMMDSEFIKPDPEKAEQFFKENHPHNVHTGAQYSFFRSTFGRDVVDNPCSTRCDPFKEGVDSDFAHFGPGLSAYFNMLKAFGWLYFIFTILTIPIMIINGLGGSALNEFLATTVGNLFEPFNLAELESGSEVDALTFRVFIPGLCPGNSTCFVDRESILDYYVGTEIVITILFLCTLEYLRYFLRKDSVAFAKNQPNLEYYTVEAENIPPDTTYLELKEFFEENCGPVNDVQVVDNNHDLIAKAINYSQMKKRMEEVGAIMNARQSKYGYQHRKTQRAYREFQRLKKRCEEFWSVIKYEEEMEALEEDSAPTAHVTRAFVTFETRQAHKTCLAMYGRTGNCFTCYGRLNRLPCLPDLDEVAELREHKPFVKDSPPPSTIVWENITYPKSSRRWRTFGSFVAAFFLLLFSWIISALIGVYSQGFESEFDLDELSLDDCVGEEQLFLNLTQGNATISLEAIQATPFQTQFCYCQSSLSESAISNVVCPQFAFSTLQTVGANAAGALVVIIVNEVLLKLLERTVTFEKHYDVVIEESALLFRVFIATYINSALIVLLENSDTDALFGFSLAGLGLSPGNYADLTSPWYGEVGLEIMIFAILNIFGPHIVPLAYYLYRSYRRRFHEPLSQIELNRLYLGPGFSLSVRYAQFLVLVFLCFTYSSGIPVLNLICCISLLVTFWVDKFMFLKVCRTPPVYSNLMASQARSILQYAPILHLILAIAMFSAPDIFPESLSDRQSILSQILVSTIVPETLANNTVTTDASTRLTFQSIALRMLRPSNLPLTLTLVGLIVFYILANFALFSLWINKLRKRFIKWLISKDEDVDDLDDDEGNFANVSVLKSDRSLLKGVSSYNILANPSYKRNFVLPDKFQLDEVHTSGEIVRHLAKDVRGHDFKIVTGRPSVSED